LYRARAQLERNEDRGAFTRSFAYASGPAYGLLLDGASPNWNHKLRAPGDLGQILGAAFGIDLPGEPQAAAEAALVRYDGRDVKADEERRETKRAAQAKADRQRYFDGPVLVLPVTEINYSYNPNDVRAYEANSSVYNTLSASDAWGVLDASGGALLVREDSGRIREVRVPAPTHAKAGPLEGDGWSLKIADGWELAQGARAGDYTIKKK
jgi:hypothetical protein